MGTPQRISTVYSNFLKDIKTGDRVMIDDGTLRLDVVSLVAGKAVCKVVVGGLLKSKKGINLPNVNISAPSVTDKDFDDLEWGLKNAVDYVALSFVRSADDIEKVRSACSKVKRPPKIVAKIERPEAIANLSDIIISADALMVARGDLGVEMDAEEVPLLQKRIITDAHRYDKPVITATQMLESMAQNPRPTRAEVSDVAGAIFDNTDAVMLSGETAAGRYPVEAVETMARIARRTERHIIESGGLRAYGRSNNASCPVDAVCLGAGAMADELNLKAIVVSSITGSTARFMSTARPSAPIIGMTNDPDAIGGMCLYWGVEPILVPQRFTNRQEFENAVETALSRAPIEINAGDLVVVTYGNPIGEPVPTNTVMVYPCRGN
ncbi:MAG: pyruvate kinase [Planctomycetota bacterium]